MAAKGWEDKSGLAQLSRFMLLNKWTWQISQGEKAHVEEREPMPHASVLA